MNRTQLKWLLNLVIIGSILMTPFRVAVSSIDGSQSMPQMVAVQHVELHNDVIDAATDELVPKVTCENQCSDCASCSMVYSAYYHYSPQFLETRPEQRAVSFEQAELEVDFDPPR